MNNTIAGRVEVSPSSIEITGLDGKIPEGPFSEAALEAIDTTAEETGAQGYHSDGDRWLDLDNGGDPEVALGMIVRILANRGFPVIVVEVRDCPACEHDERDPKCPTCGGRGHVDNRAF